MVTCEKYSPNMSYEWDKFVQSSRTPLFMFERSFVDYHANRFEDSSLILTDDSGIIALMPANKVGNEIVSHGGLTYGGSYLLKSFQPKKCSMQ